MEVVKQDQEAAVYQISEASHDRKADNGPMRRILPADQFQKACGKCVSPEAAQTAGAECRVLGYSRAVNLQATSRCGWGQINSVFSVQFHTKLIMTPMAKDR